MTEIEPIAADEETGTEGAQESVDPRPAVCGVPMAVLDELRMSLPTRTQRYRFAEVVRVLRTFQGGVNQKLKRLAKLEAERQERQTVALTPETEQKLTEGLAAIDAEGLGPVEAQRKKMQFVFALIDPRDLLQSVMGGLAGGNPYTHKLLADAAGLASAARVATPAAKGAERPDMTFVYTEFEEGAEVEEEAEPPRRGGKTTLRVG